MIKRNLIYEWNMANATDKPEYRIYKKTLKGVNQTDNIIYEFWKLHQDPEGTFYWKIVEDDISMKYEINIPLAYMLCHLIDKFSDQIDAEKMTNDLLKGE